RARVQVAAAARFNVRRARRAAHAQVRAARGLDVQHAGRYVDRQIAAARGTDPQIVARERALRFDVGATRGVQRYERGQCHVHGAPVAPMEKTERAFSADLQRLPDDFCNDLGGVFFRRLDLDDETVALADEEIDATPDLDGVEARERATLARLRVGARGR